MRRIILTAALCLLAVPLLAQKPTPAATPMPLPASTTALTTAPTPAPKIDDAFVHQQFGDQFTLIPTVGAAFGDLDGDGIEDVVIAARCKNPMLDQSEHNFSVIDPYDSFFGYGNPQVTTTFSAGDPALRGLVMLVIDGSGADAWRSTAPKAKYVIVNLPFKAIYVRKFKLKKKTIQALYVEEAGEISSSSALFFDGKKFQYVPMGGEME
jgi:hypothetical protein